MRLFLEETRGGIEREDIGDRKGTQVSFHEYEFLNGWLSNNNAQEPNQDENPLYRVFIQRGRDAALHHSVVLSPPPRNFIRTLEVPQKTIKGNYPLFSPLSPHNLQQKRKRLEESEYSHSLFPRL